MRAPKKPCKQAWRKLQIQELPALSEHAGMLCQGLFQAARPVFPVCPPLQPASWLRGAPVILWQILAALARGWDPEQQLPLVFSACTGRPTPTELSWPSAWQKAGKDMKTKARCQAQLASLQSLLVHIASARASLLRTRAPPLSTGPGANCSFKHILPQHPSIWGSELLQATKQQPDLPQH